VGHAHVVIVDHHRQHIDGRSIRAQQHHIIKRFVFDCHITLHLITDHGLPILWGLDTHDKGRVRVGNRIRIAPRGVVKRAAPLSLCGVAIGGDLILCRETLESFASGQQLMRDRCMTCGIVKLADDFSVMIQTKP
jgi:hypothetical protein